MNAIDTSIGQTQDELHLRSVLLTKIHISLLSSSGLFLALYILAFYIWEALPSNQIIVWVLLITATMLLRMAVMRGYSPKIDSLDYQGLLKFKWSLLCCSLMVQAAVGSGIWFLGPEATTLMKLSMTAAICFYGIGIILALSNDYRVYLYSSTLLFMQPLVYWLFQGIEFYWVSLTIIFVVFVGLTIVRTISKNFAESISIRFEQNGLMANLVHARTETLFALQKAEKAIMDKAFYLASASHDLRQPLFAVNMINETLQLHELPDSALRLLKIQSQSIDAMNNMFNNLLDISQFESKKITIVRKDFDINDLQLSMADEFSTIAAKKGLQFRFEIPQVAVHSDFDLVGRVLRNLISNAICHTTTGEVVVSGEVLNQELVIAVHDTGQGIDEADHERIFDPFVQLNPAPGTGKTSIGVGLSIVKHISELLDLRLQLKSKPEMGTTMSFYLPIAS